MHPEPALISSAQARASIVVGLVDAGDGGELAAVAALAASLDARFPGHGAVVLPPSKLSAPPAMPGAHREGSITAATLDALVAAAQLHDASACALVSGAPRAAAVDWLGLLLSPIVEQGFDFVCPSYVRHKSEALINTGIVYPLTRALFGKRLRQPLGSELAGTRALLESIRDNAEWLTDPAHAGADLWLVTKVLSQDLRVCQAYLGPPPQPPHTSGDLSVTLALILGTLFHEIERHADHWQRVRTSSEVPTFGEATLLDEPRPWPQLPKMVAAFELGVRDLSRLWAEVLSPATLLALQRAAARPAERFELEDPLWARAVYAFAVAYAMKRMSRPQLLRSMTPLYLGWAASWARQVEGMNAAEVEVRLEALCRAFEAEKSTLISRWRWPDRFTP